jgi:hypothetical protein
MEDSISHSDDTESVGAAANDEVNNETRDEKMKSAHPDDLNEMIKGVINELVTKGSESTPLQESDGQSDDNETPDSLIASAVDDYQPQSDETPEIEGAQPTEDRISELEKVIKEKDLRISELEAENSKLRARIRELEVQKEVSDDYEGLITDIETEKEIAY